MIFGISGTKGTVCNRGVRKERLDCVHNIQFKTAHQQIYNEC